MKNEIELESIIEDYLQGKLSAEEQIAFEQLRKNDQNVDHKVVAHKMLLEAMQQYAYKLDLNAKMNAAHQTIDVDGLKNQLRSHSSKIICLWRQNKSIIAVAASFLVLLTITFLSIQHSDKQSVDFESLSRDLAQIKRSQNNLIRDMKSAKASKTVTATPARFGGTGFAISSNGYILTNYHVIKDADSVYVQNSKGESFKVKSFYSDQVNDIAILKITDKDFKNLKSLPYSLKKNIAALGEMVYTLGYPKDDVVFGDGYVSSKNGHNGDTVAYQVAISVNPGNSGGPILDNNGNIVGVINGKEEKTDGAAFAVKSKYIMHALNAIPADSLIKRLSYSKRSVLQGLKRSKQVEKIQDYVFMVKVYN